MDKSKSEKKRYKKFLSDAFDFEGETYQHESTKRKLSKSSDSPTLDGEPEDFSVEVTPPRKTTLLRDTLLDNPVISILTAVVLAIGGITIPTLISQNYTLGAVESDITNLKELIGNLQEKYDEVSSIKIDLEILKSRIRSIETF